VPMHKNEYKNIYAHIKISLSLSHEVINIQFYYNDALQSH